MSHRRTWNAPQPTKARRILNYLERVRYRLEYRRRLRLFKRARPDVAAYRLTPGMRREIREYWAQFGLSHVNLDWFRLFYALTGQVDPRFIPEETFRVEIERWLNAPSIADAYSDKNLLDRRFPDVVRPESILRCMHGRYYAGDYTLLDRRAASDLLQSLAGDFLIKPSIGDTGSGNNVNLIHVENGRIQNDGRSLSLPEIEMPYVGNFVVQRRVSQHASMAAFYAGSFNTCRVITLRLGSDHKVVGATFRMGNGSYVDNGHAGGLLCGVDIASGTLTARAVDVKFREYDRHPSTGRAFANQSIHAFDEMKRVALLMHESLTYFDMVSFDIGLADTGDPCLIEVNLWGQGIEPHQVLKGRPLFGDDTDAVLGLIAERRRRALG